MRMLTTKQENKAFRKLLESREFTVAFKAGPKIYRGKPGQIHFQVYSDIMEDIERRTGIKPEAAEKALQRAYEKGQLKEGFQHARTGKFYTRDQLRQLIGQGESLQAQKELESATPQERTARTRRLPPEAIKEGKKAPKPRGLHRRLGVIRQEMRTAEGSRLAQLVRRRGVLKTLGGKKGLLAVVGTPIETISNIKQALKEEEGAPSTRFVKLVEDLLGLPKGFTGRPKTKSERELERML